MKRPERSRSTSGFFNTSAESEAGRTGQGQERLAELSQDVGASWKTCKSRVRELDPLPASAVAVGAATSRTPGCASIRPQGKKSPRLRTNQKPPGPGCDRCDAMRCDVLGWTTKYPTLPRSAVLGDR